MSCKIALLFLSLCNFKICAMCARPLDPWAPLAHISGIAHNTLRAQMGRAKIDGRVRAWYRISFRLAWFKLQSSMACVPTDVTPAPELLAISKHASDLCKGITKVSTVTSFALSLEQESLITSDAKSSILGTTGISEMYKCSRLLDAVREQVRIDGARLKSLIRILRRDPALSHHADMVATARGELIRMFCVCI